jgi:hypothetical protein
VDETYIYIGEQMSKGISHSAWEKYSTCPKIYDYHYNERLRSDANSSALAFGVAIDAGLNKLLLTKNLDEAIVAFRESFKFEDLGNVVFEAKDLDNVLLPREELDTNHAKNAWKSMRIKGRMLIEEYDRVIMPMIEEVHSVQEELSCRSGIVDAIVTIRGHGRVVLDNKTSARPYDADAVANSTQLALYCADKKIDKGAFAVLVKTVDKRSVRTCSSCKFDGASSKHKTCPVINHGVRCHGEWIESHEPQVNVQLLVDKMPKVTSYLITESIRETERAIESKIYPRNLKSCGRIYGKPCPYFNKCWRGSNEGLEIKEETKE